MEERSSLACETKEKRAISRLPYRLHTVLRMEMGTRVDKPGMHHSMQCGDRVGRRALRAVRRRGRAPRVARMQIRKAAEHPPSGIGTDDVLNCSLEC